MPGPARAAGPRLQWHLIYSPPAAFDILTVTASLYLNLRISDMYVHAVASNQDWAQLLADASALEDLAGIVNSAGNEVFASRDPAGEPARPAAPQAGAKERLAALRNDLLATLSGDQSSAVLGQLSEVERRLGLMGAASEQVLADSAAGPPGGGARTQARP